MLSVLQKKSHLKSCKAALIKLSEFLSEHLPTINVCMVDFITEDHFQSCLNDSLKIELMGMTTEEIKLLPQKLVSFKNYEKDENIATVQNIFRQISQLSLEIELGRCLWLGKIRKFNCFQEVRNFSNFRKLF